MKLRTTMPHRRGGAMRHPDQDVRHPGMMRDARASLPGRQRAQAD